MQKPKLKKPKLLKIIPFQLLSAPGLKPNVFTTSRSERVIKLAHHSFRTKSISSFDTPSHNDSSKFFHSQNNSSKLLPSLSEPSHKQLSDTSHSTLSPQVDGNLARLSNLRYYNSNSVLHLPLLPLTPTALSFNEKFQYPIIEETPDSEEREQFMKKKHLGYWSSLRCEGISPKSGENTQIFVSGDLLVVCGGQSYVKHLELKILDLKSKKWRMVKTSKAPKGRLGHSMVGYKQKLFIFGGWTTSQNLERQIQGKMFKVSLNKCRWEKCFGSGERPSPRQYHAASQLGCNMLIFGGIDSQNHVQSDLCILDLKEIKWKSPDLIIVNHPGPRSHCTLTAVFHQTLKSSFNFSIEKIPRLKEEFSLPNSAFYLFGGLTANRAPCNELHALFIRNSKLIWSEVKVSGIPPSPRYSHTAHAIHSSLFIYGGRNDFIGGHSQEALNDLFVLNVKVFKWERVEVFGAVPEGRWAHGMAAYSTSLIIFGGITYNKFMPAEVLVLETSRVEAERRVRHENNKK